MNETYGSTEQKSEFGEIAGKIDGANPIVYEKLNASNDKVAKQEFLENPDLIHPNNEYGNLDENEVRNNLELISEAMGEADSSWLTDKERAFIDLVATDARNKNEFLAANIAYNQAQTPEEKLEATIWHHEANEKLYGKPDKDTFNTLLEEKISSIDKDSLSEEDKKVYERLMSNIGAIEHSEKGRFKPKAETVERFSELVKDFYGGFLEHIPENQEEFSSEEAVGIINEILQTEFDGEVDYKAIVDSKAANASAGRGIIKFPEGNTYSKERLSALIVHELGTHAMRAIPYQDQDNKAFTTGLPENETWDEGVAGCMEQALKGAYKDFGVDHYINIGLANFKGKNFREIYDIQMDLKHLTGEDNSKVLNAVQRCFRGTGELPNNKDLAYYTGNSKVWQYIEKHIDDPELFDNLFLAGKTDASNHDQERLVYEMRTKGNL
ncbi:DUF1704 domain-containing protein [Candidatus Saccharibacteria bacterium]|nr:DUF1704 domain-containing protein [Candidatus Saccharibacteria bacterium]